MGDQLHDVTLTSSLTSRSKAAANPNGNSTGETPELPERPAFVFPLSTSSIEMGAKKSSAPKDLTKWTKNGSVLCFGKRPAISVKMLRNVRDSALSELQTLETASRQTHRCTAVASM
jgi:hypothetical protein